MWQDIVISIGAFLFIVIIIPQMIDSFRGVRFINPITAGLTTLVLIMFAIVYWTLNLFTASTIQFINCLQWIVLFYLTVKNTKKCDRE